jgi:hypothetical protein
MFQFGKIWKFWTNSNLTWICKGGCHFLLALTSGVSHTPTWPKVYDFRFQGTHTQPAGSPGTGANELVHVTTSPDGGDVRECKHETKWAAYLIDSFSPRGWRKRVGYLKRSSIVREACWILLELVCYLNPCFSSLPNFFILYYRTLDTCDREI